MYTLLIRLSGPLQSWGSDSLYDYRKTDYYPTKSGVVGMIAAALGKKRHEPLDELNELQFGVRIDNQGTYIKDFQITEMGEKLNANLSTREYLSDATFLVGLSSEKKDILEKIQNAIHNPKYAIYMGRKSCPPTMPLDMGIKEVELYMALNLHEWLVPDWNRAKMFGKNDKIVLRIIVESDKGALKKDVPISFESNNRKYAYRGICDMPGKTIYKDYMGDETNHDPMRELV